MPTPAVARIIQDSFARQNLLAETLGARLESIDDGEVTIVLPFGPHLTQQHGFAHAGAIASIADSACGYACLTRMPPGSSVLSVEFKINLLAPASGDHFISRGSVVRMGRTLGIATAEVTAIRSDHSPIRIAMMQATMMRVNPPGGAVG